MRRIVNNSGGNGLIVELLLAGNLKLLFSDLVGLKFED